MIHRSSVMCVLYVCLSWRRAFESTSRFSVCMCVCVFFLCIREVKRKKKASWWLLKLWVDMKKRTVTSQANAKPEFSSSQYKLPRNSPAKPSFHPWNTLTGHSQTHTSKSPSNPKPISTSSSRLGIRFQGQIKTSHFVRGNYTGSLPRWANKHGCQLTPWRQIKARAWQGTGVERSNAGLLTAHSFPLTCAP